MSGPEQLPMFDLLPAADVEVPDLAGFDLIVIRSSGGKDSQTALRETVRQARAQGVPLARLVVEYDELGEESVTWPGTAAIGPHLVERYGDRPGSKALVELQAAHYGLRVVARSAARPNLLEDVRTRTGKDGRHRWPDARNRWCTSDHKRSVGDQVLNALVLELGLPAGHPARVLTVMGFRAAESRSRAVKPAYARDERASRAGKTRAVPAREVWQWLPIHTWSDDRVWADIRESGVPYAWPYDAGMSRFSCTFCVLARRADLVTAARLMPDRARAYAAVEFEIGHDFQQRNSMRSVCEEAGIELWWEL